jgi:predicted branched-subunit amino acid permease
MISLFNVTSAGQLAGVPIIASGGGLIELAMTQLVINSRYALMSVSLSQKFGKSIRLCDRFPIAFVNTDEVFAIATSKHGTVGRKYMYGLLITPVLGWTFGTLVGAVAGNILPLILISALGIAIYAMFVAIVVPAARDSLSTAICAGISVLLSCLFNYVPVFSVIPDGFVIIICAVIAAVALAVFAPLPDEDAEEKEEIA